MVAPPSVEVILAQLKRISGARYDNSSLTRNIAEAV
jgi:hypothetical protein